MNRAWYTEVWDPAMLEGRRHELYAARLAHVRKRMDEAGVGALLLVDPNDVFYASGARNMQIFAMRTPARYLLIVQGGPAILYEYVGCEHLAAGLPTVDEVRPAEGLCAISSGGRVLEASARFAAEIASVVRAQQGKLDRIAIDRFPFRAVDALRKEGFDLVPAEDVLLWARAIKLPIELPYLREAMRRIDGAVERLAGHARPGQSETEAWAEFHYALMAKEGQYASTRLFQSGPNTFPYFQECGGRRLEKGDLLCLDTDAVAFENYCVDYSRTFLCGDDCASDDQQTLYARAREQLEWNAALLSPWMEFRELAQKAWTIPDEHQASRYYCIGHGLGMAGEWPNIPHHRRGEPYPLDGHVRPGMIVCLESYVGWERSREGVKLEDQFLILEDGVERMSRYGFDERLGRLT